MQLSRRDLLKLGGLGAIGAAGLALPFGREVSAGTPSLLPTKLMPKPYQVPFAAAPTAKPYKTVTDYETGKPKHYYDISALKGSAKHPAHAVHGGPGLQLGGDGRCGAGRRAGARTADRRQPGREDRA